MEINVHMVACELSILIMGIKQNELLDDIEYGGIATYLGDVSNSK